MDARPLNADLTTRILRSIAGVIDGKDDAVRSALVCLPTEGHLLIEDVPGVGKTMLARALAASVDATIRRIQLLPTCSRRRHGRERVRPGRAGVRVKQGAVFAHIVIADEINSSSPKTQSVGSAGGNGGAAGRSTDTPIPLPDPFLVVATQNPLEM